MNDSYSGDSPPKQTPRETPPRAESVVAFTRGGRASGAISEGSSLYQLLVESIVDYAIFALDANGIILTWNPGAQRFKGYAAEEIIGKHFSIFYSPEERAAGKPQDELRIASRDGKVEDEGWRIRKDGSQFWANVVITALRDPQGTLVGFAKVTRDLTERRRGEEALRTSEERFRLLVHSVKDYGIFMLDPDGCVASWNEGARRIKGYEAEEILGRHFSTFYPPEAIASELPRRELEVAHAVGRFEDEGWRVRKDGSLFWANVVITALFNDKEVLIGFAKVTRDLTERRAAQLRELDDARRLAAAEASNRAKAGFLAAMSHELRTPLNAIAGYAQLMDEGIGGEVSRTQREWLTRIRASQTHLLGIVNDLLNYTRIEAGAVSYESATVPLHEVLDGVLAMIAHQTAKKRQRLVHEPPSQNVAARADRLKVEQIVLNLLSNAVKFTPEKGTITASCGVGPGTVMISVGDTGPGIPGDMRSAIFEPFVQLGRTLTSAHEGTGLGLSISRDLARAMGGDVTVAGVAGEGAMFTLILPAA